MGKNIKDWIGSKLNNTRRSFSNFFRARRSQSNQEDTTRIGHEAEVPPETDQKPKPPSPSKSENSFGEASGPYPSTTNTTNPPPIKVQMFHDQQSPTTSKGKLHNKADQRQLSCCIRPSTHYSGSSNDQLQQITSSPSTDFTHLDLPSTTRSTVSSDRVSSDILNSTSSSINPQNLSPLWPISTESSQSQSLGISSSEIDRIVHQTLEASTSKKQSPKSQSKKRGFFKRSTSFDIELKTKCKYSDSSRSTEPTSLSDQTKKRFSSQESSTGVFSLPCSPTETNPTNTSTDLTQREPTTEHAAAAEASFDLHNPDTTAKLPEENFQENETILCAIDGCADLSSTPEYPPGPSKTKDVDQKETDQSYVTHSPDAQIKQELADHSPISGILIKVSDTSSPEPMTSSAHSPFSSESPSEISSAQSPMKIVNQKLYEDDETEGASAIVINPQVQQFGAVEPLNLGNLVEQYQAVEPYVLDNAAVIHDRERRDRPNSIQLANPHSEYYHPHSGRPLTMQPSPVQEEVQPNPVQEAQSPQQENMPFVRRRNLRYVNELSPPRNGETNEFLEDVGHEDEVFLP